MSKHDAQSDRLNTTSLKNAIAFRMILNSFFNTTDTNHKDRKSCYKKYRVHRSSANIGITICTTVTVTRNLQDGSMLSKKYTWNGTLHVSYRSYQIIIYEPTEHLTNCDICYKKLRQINNWDIGSHMTQIKPFIFKLEKTLLSILPNYKKVQFI